MKVENYKTKISAAIQDYMKSKRQNRFTGRRGLVTREILPSRTLLQAGNDYEQRT